MSTATVNANTITGTYAVVFRAQSDAVNTNYFQYMYTGNADIILQFLDSETAEDLASTKNEILVKQGTTRSFNGKFGAVRAKSESSNPTTGTLTVQSLCTGNTLSGIVADNTDVVATSILPTDKVFIERAGIGSMVADAGLFGGGSSQTRLNRLCRVANWGDSTADFGGPNSTSGITDTEPMSPTGSANSWLWPDKALLLGRRRVQYVANGGKTGETTTQMIARSNAVYANTRKAQRDVISKKPDLICFHGGSVNDVIPFTTATTQATVDAVAYRHIKMATYFLSRGIPLIDPCIFGYDGNGGVPVADLTFIRAAIVSINAQIKLASEKFDNWVIIDHEGALSNAGAFIAGNTTDGTHLNDTGAKMLGDLEAAAYDTLFLSGGCGDTIVYDGDATWAAGTAGGLPSDTPFVQLTAITQNAQRCDGTQWEIDVTVTNATNEFLTLWTAAKVFSTAIINTYLFGSHDIRVVDAAGNNVNATFYCRAWVYSNTPYSQLNEVRNLITDHYKMEHPFWMPIDYVNHGANTRYGFAVRNIPVGTYTIIVKPTRISTRSVLNTLP